MKKFSWIFFFLIIFLLNNKGLPRNLVPFIIIGLVILNTLIKLYSTGLKIKNARADKRSKAAQSSMPAEQINTPENVPAELPQQKESSWKKYRARRIGKSSDASWIKDEDTWIKGD